MRSYWQKRKVEILAVKLVFEMIFWQVCSYCDIKATSNTVELCTHFFLVIFSVFQNGTLVLCSTIWDTLLYPQFWKSVWRTKSNYNQAANYQSTTHEVRVIGVLVFLQWTWMFMPGQWACYTVLLHKLWKFVQEWASD